MTRYDAISNLKQQAIDEIVDEEAGVSESEVGEIFSALEKSTVETAFWMEPPVLMDEILKPFVRLR